MAKSDDCAYLCHNCLSLFLFKSDFEDHSKETGHTAMATLKIDATFEIGDKRYWLLEIP